MIIFSFCIYGTGKKYYFGLVENIININKYSKLIYLLQNSIKNTIWFILKELNKRY